MEEIVQLSPQQFGLLGLAFAVIYGLGGKLITAAFDVAKTKYSKNGSEPKPPVQPPIIAWKNIEENISEIKSSIGNIEKDTEAVKINSKANAKQIERLIHRIDGNGREGFAAQLTRIETRLEDHRTDKGLHTAER